jgi:hypothetical protein
VTFVQSRSGFVVSTHHEGPSGRHKDHDPSESPSGSFRDLRAIAQATSWFQLVGARRELPVLPSLSKELHHEIAALVFQHAARHHEPVIEPRRFVRA